MNKAYFIVLGILVGFTMAGSASAAELPEVAVERSDALCGNDPQLNATIRAVHQAIRQHRFQTTGSAELVVTGTLNVDIGDVAVLEDRGDLVREVMFVGGGRPRRGFVTDTTEIVQRFYSTHSDLYDAVVIFAGSGFVGNVEPEAGFAFSQGVRNNVLGIGLPLFDNAAALGLSTTKLKNIINMNDLKEFVGPDSNIVGAPFNVTGEEVLAQEVGHRWGAFVNTDVADILGRGDAHWSFFFDTDDDPTSGPGASVMEGNGWVDNGDGSFTTTRPFDSYSQLDEYVMGLRLSSEITDTMFFVKEVKEKKGGGKGNNGKKPPKKGPNNASEGDLPEEGVTVDATSVPVTIQDVIAANGTRVPSLDPAISNLAFILVVPDNGVAGTIEAPDADLDEVNDFSDSFSVYYTTHTDGRGTATHALNP